MSGLNDSIRVLKLNLSGEVTWQYEGHVVRREPNAVVLQALFDREDMPFVDVVFKRNDLFLESFYTDRWYNIFEIHDRDDGALKGWYCNIGRPATLGNAAISYVDLALDLWVSADGTQTVLDRDEFDALMLEQGERATALAALSELQHMFKTKRPPF